MPRIQLSDSLQIVQDTLVVTQSSSSLDWFSFIATVLIAVFTGGYLIYTRKLFLEAETQTRAAKKSAEAALDSNEISKRSEFYPVFDMRIKGEGPGPFYKVSSTLENLSDNIIFDVSIFYLIWQPKDKINEVRKDPSEGIMLSVDCNIISGFHTFRSLRPKQELSASFSTRFEITRLRVLTRFSDALQNTYYRTALYEPSGGPDRPPYLKQIESDTTGLDPKPKYKLEVLGQCNTLLVPEDNNWGSADELTGSEIPEHVATFNEEARDSTAYIHFGE